MKNFKNKIFCGDSLEIMKEMPDNSFDFCFADPPYFMQIKEGKKLFRVEGTEFKGCNDDWDKFESMETYKEFTKKWLKEIKRLLKDDGSICVISGMQSIFEIGNILRELGFWIINDIIWKKSNPTPNFGGTRLNNSHETIIWASKSKNTKFTFNYKTGKFLNNGKQMGSIWTFPVCNGNERLKDNEGKKLHNTQKPEALLYRIIALFTNKDDLILDPFGGTMTTGVVAKKMGRNYTIIEKDNKYISYGQERINKTIPQIGDVENATFDKKPIRVSLKEMINAGYYQIGEKFYLKNGKFAILSTNDGKVTFNNETNSIHEIAGKMLGLNRRVNAFDVFMVERNGDLISINDIRSNYRDSLLLKTN